MSVSDAYLTTDSILLRRVLNRQDITSCHIVPTSAVLYPCLPWEKHLPAMRRVALELMDEPNELLALQ